MGRFWTAFAIGLLLLGAAHTGAPAAHAGDEDNAQEAKAKPEREAPADTALPEEQEEPEMSVGGQPEEKSPEFQEAPLAPGKDEAGKKPIAQRSLDDNIDYSGILGMVETGEAPRGVLAPAEGFRGYRPNMVAVGYGDRTPGWGGMIEYSWNRIGAGVFGSVRSARASAPAGSTAQSTTSYQSYGGIYGLYRILPWGVSPYFLLGVEAANNAEEPLGGLTGGGIEARVYLGWTLLLGWSYHSTARRGFLGGAVGWSF